jgi:hypothetical protein
MDPVGQWGIFKSEAANQILAFGKADGVSTRADVKRAANAAGKWHGTEFSANMTKGQMSSDLKGKPFMITEESGDKFIIFIPYVRPNGIPNGGGTSTSITRSLVEITPPHAIDQYFEHDEYGVLPKVKPEYKQMAGGRRKTKSKKSKKSKSKSKSKKSKRKTQRR